MRFLLLIAKSGTKFSDRKRNKKHNLMLVFNRRLNLNAVTLHLGSDAVIFKMIIRHI